MKPLALLHLLVVLSVVAWPTSASSEPYRLRADALGSTPSPAGLIVLTGDARPASWINAEAVLWGGSGDHSADALVAALRLRHPGGRGDLTLGRFVVATGAVRPIHIDGGWIRSRLPGGIMLEAFGGLPVAPLDTWNDEQHLAGVDEDVHRQDSDWAVGGRVSETITNTFGVGASFVERRDFGRVSDREVGGDLWLSPAEKFDISSRLAWDLVMAGVSEAHVSATYRLRDYRIEAFGMRRSPARLLPATSIFSALGDVPSDTLGLNLTWFAAPRLDVRATASARWAGASEIGQNDVDAQRARETDLGVDAVLRATLRLDDQGAGQLAVEARRFGVEPGAWSGLRLRVRVPVYRQLAASTELELARPDEPRGRGEVWPWGLVAFGGRFAEHWEASAGVEAYASPEKRRAVSGILRLAYRFDGGRP